ncbi:MAG: hypothetical protein ACMXYD_05225 [Candidatus Woesearchaeota archaeon]
MRAVTLIVLTFLLLPLVTASFSGGAAQSDLLYVTSTVSYTTEPGTPTLASAQDGTVNQMSLALTSSNLYTFINAETTSSSQGVITASETIFFSSYWSTGDRVNQAYATFKFFIDDVLVCQDGNDGTGGVLIPSNGVGLRTGSCSPSADFSFDETSTLRYTVTVWAQDIAGGSAGARTAALQWDTTTANTSVLIESIMPSQVSLLLDNSSYEQGEVVTASGVYSWLNGTPISGADVVVNWTSPSSSVEQSTTVVTNSFGEWEETFSIPGFAEIGTWSVLVEAEADTDITATNSTTFSVTEATGPQRLITVEANDTQYAQGETASVSGRFFFDNDTSLAGEEVTVRFFDPDSVLQQSRNVTTNATGHFTETYTIPISALTGTWEVEVEGHDDSTSTFNSTTFLLVADETDTIVVDTDQSSYEQGATVTASGQYAWLNGTPISSEEVVIRFFTPSSSLAQETSVFTNATGHFTETHALAVSADTGTWSVQAQGNVTGTELTTSTTFSVTQAPQETISVTADTNYVQNDTVFVSGVFSWDNSTPLVGETVTVRFISPSASILQEQNVTTNGVGVYSDSFDTTAQELGVWTIEVDGWREGSVVVSNSRTFTLLSEPLAAPEGFCVGVYVETGPNHVAGLVQQGDVFEYVCTLSSPLRRNQNARLDVLFSNAQLSVYIFTPRVLLEGEVLFP